MISVVSFGIAIVSLSSVASLSLLLMWKQIQSQNLTIRTLTNLATSKDLETFQKLQATTSLANLSQPNPQDEPVNPLNDEVIARRLASQFEAQGLDPNLAYAKDDDFDFRSEFGV